MRHVSRTHRVALDWLFDRIKLDPKNPNQSGHQKPTRWHPNQRKFHTWWVESFVVLVSILAISVLQFALIQWRNDLNKIQEKNESQQNLDQWWALLQGCRRTYRPRLQRAPGKRCYGNQDPWSTIAEKEERSGRPDIGIDRMKASDYYYHEQFMESFSSASYSKWDDDRAWSAQE